MTSTSQRSQGLAAQQGGRPLLIAADGGAARCLAAGLWPDVVVGDFDSLAGEVLDRLRGHGVEVRSASRDKDESDMELCLLLALARGLVHVAILGALGLVRPEHSLANVLLLADPRFDALRLRILGRGSVTWRVGTADGPGEAIVAGAAGDLVSLLPIEHGSRACGPRACDSRSRTRSSRWARRAASPTSCSRTAPGSRPDEAASSSSTPTGWRPRRRPLDTRRTDMPTRPISGRPRRAAGRAARPAASLRAAAVPAAAARRLVTLLAGAAVLLAGALPAAAQDETLTLMTHDSFYLPDAVIEAFEAEHGVQLEVLASGDAGSMVNQAILTADRPLADVLYGIDNTFLSRALEAGIFEPYRSPALEAVPAELVARPGAPRDAHRHGDVCLNIDRVAFDEGDLPVPETLEDLLDPALADQLVVENPATSSPGLAFLLATIATFGEDPETGWQAFWSGLRDNDVQVTAGWEEAYYGAFSGGSGEGDRPIVVSYASSPAAEVVFGPDPETDESPTAALDGRLLPAGRVRRHPAGTDQPELAGALIDHLLAPETQAELPLAMYVYPARTDVALPEVFERFALRPEAPLSLDPQAIAAGREEWIRQWTDIVLR